MFVYHQITDLGSFGVQPLKALDVTMFCARYQKSISVELRGEWSKHVHLYNNNMSQFGRNLKPFS